VRGRVVNSRDGQPLGLVQVALAGTSSVTVTDDSGSFRFASLPAGEYVLEATAVGYHTVRQEFVLAAGDTRAFEVVLTSATIKLTDSASVTADAFEQPVSSAGGFTLEGHEIANLASVLADDPLRAVQSLPGVTSNDDFSSEFSVRGAPFDRVGLYLDGVLLHSPFHTTDGVPANGSLSIFSGDLTDGMTLYEGAWPVRYSNRTAGVLAVETRQGTREDVRAEATASASNAGVLVEGPLGSDKRGSWIVATRKSYLQYILNRIDFGDQAPLSFGFADVQARLDYDLSARHAISLTLLDGSSSVDRSRYRAELGPGTVMTSGFHFTLLNLGSRYASPRLLVASHLAWSRDNGQVGNRDHVTLSDTDHTEGTLRSDATFLWNTRNTVEFGGQLRRLGEDGSLTQLVYSPNLTTTEDRFVGTGWESGTYAQETLDLGRVRLAAGLRHDQHSLSTVTITTPYASLSLKPRIGMHVQFDWGQYAQFPELNQYFSAFTPGPLQPERATHYDALVEQRLDERTRIRVEAYDRQDRDVLARPALDPRLSADGSVVDAQPTAPWRNSQSGYARGIQLTLQRRTANGFTGWVSYAYGRTSIWDDTLQLRFPSDYEQRHTINAYVSRRIRPTVNVSGRFAFGSGMPLPGFYRVNGGEYELDVNRDGLRAPVYQRTDLRVNKALVRARFNATLFAEVVNVTNRTNSDFDTPGPYNPLTARTTPNFYTMFPVLPSLGIVVTFGHGGVHGPT
jgi:hypothetical protein